MRLDPYTELFFVSTILEKTFFLKIFLAMASFAVYLYFALSGTKGRRATQVVFYRFVLFDADLYSDYHITPSADGRGMACLC